MNYQDVVNFWFEEIDPVCWWVKDIKFDQEIISKFQQVHCAAKQGELAHWRESPVGRLAEIIVLDQFSRNMYRDTPQAFTNDGVALVLAQEAIALGADKTLKPIENSFLYMPFMHSESLVIHEQALRLYQANGIASNVEFELKHKAIIEQFGRYPHRNSILKRQSTTDEIDFLKQPGSSF